MKKACLVDVCSVFFRYYFSPTPEYLNDQGWDVSALLNTVRWLCKKELLESHVVVLAFDESLGTGFRHQLNKEYKANRALPTQDVIYQLELLKSITEYLGFVVLVSDEFEADDLIASAATNLSGYSCFIYTRDKDLKQLISEHVTWVDSSNGSIWESEDVIERMGIGPSQIALYLAIVGDSSDNIKGVPGVGDKTAQRLLQEFDGWESLLEYAKNNDELPVRGGSRICQSILSHQSLVKENLMLTELRDDVTISLQSGSLHEENWLTLNELLKQVNLLEPLKKALQLVSGYRI